MLLDGLAEAKTLLGKHGFDFFERSIAKVFEGAELGFGDFEEVAKCANVHLAKCVASADGKLEICDRCVE